MITLYGWNDIYTPPSPLRQKGFPLWFRAVHVIHTPKMLKIMHGLAMPFLSARTRVRLSI